MKPQMKEAIAIVIVIVFGFSFFLYFVHKWASQPIVQMEWTTHQVVGVITADGIKHPAEYYAKIKDGWYEVEWVRPRSMMNPSMEEFEKRF